MSINLYELTNPGDTTLNNSLSLENMDNNFIFLKQKDIIDIISTSTTLSLTTEDNVSYSANVINIATLTGYTNVDIEHTIFVSTKGNDGTASVYNISKPYKTLSAAHTNAIVGDTIYIWGGDYTTSSSFTKDGVRVISNGNVNILYTGVSYLFNYSNIIYDIVIDTNISMTSTTGGFFRLDMPYNSGISGDTYANIYIKFSKIRCDSLSIYMLGHLRPASGIRPEIEFGDVSIIGDVYSKNSYALYFNLQRSWVSCIGNYSSSGTTDTIYSNFNYGSITLRGNAINYTNNYHGMSITNQGYPAKIYGTIKNIKIIDYRNISTTVFGNLIGDNNIIAGESPFILYGDVIGKIFINSTITSIFGKVNLNNLFITSTTSKVKIYGDIYPSNSNNINMLLSAGTLILDYDIICDNSTAFNINVSGGTLYINGALVSDSDITNTPLISLNSSQSVVKIKGSVINRGSGPAINVSDGKLILNKGVVTSTGSVSMSATTPGTNYYVYSGFANKDVSNLINILTGTTLQVDSNIE